MPKIGQREEVTDRSQRDMREGGRMEIDPVSAKQKYIDKMTIEA